MTTGVKVAIIGAIGVIGAAAVTGLFQWVSKRSDSPSVVAERKDAPPPFKAAPQAERAKHDEQYSPESVEARRSLRGNLRNLVAAESGLRIQKVPAGTFGFVHSSLFKYSDFEVERTPNGRLSFEVHKPAADQVYAVAFVNADARRKLELTNTVTEPVTLYTEIWKDAPYAVRVLVPSCIAEHARMIETDENIRLVAVDCAPQKKRSR